MPGYLIWLNARLYEMKRLLKKTGSIYVHCDWHASHYIKVEMDKIVGYGNFRNEVIWSYTNAGGRSKTRFARKHDTILWYTKSDAYTFNGKHPLVTEERRAGKDSFGGIIAEDETGRPYQEIKSAGKSYRYYLDEGKIPEDVWNIQPIPPHSKERIGYPTQKPERLFERIITAATNEDGVVADFFAGGGTTACVAQRLGRSWIACDQSRVAVAITADRLTRQVEEQTGQMFAVPDFTVEHWGVYELSA